MRTPPYRLKGLLATETSPAVVLEDVTKSIAEIEARREALLEEAIRICRADEVLCERLDALDSMPMVGELTAVALLGGFVGLPEDMAPRQIVAHAGLDPRPRQSGTSVRGRTAISRVGNARLRGALHMAAVNAARRHPEVGRIHAALLARGKRPMVAIVAITRKLLVVAWRLYVSRERFDPARFGRGLQAAA